MKDIKDEPLKSIFAQNLRGIFSPEIKNMENIEHFFEYLKDSKNSIENKIKIIEAFRKIIKDNRFICEYFSSFENKSIYIFLFELFLENNSNDILQSSIINLLKDLIIDLEIDKNIFNFIFQKISGLYREEEQLIPGALTKYLTLLNTIISDTENKTKPYNYYIR